MSTYLYLDSSDPKETKDLLAKNVLLAGQTTNPSLVKSNPCVAQRIEQKEFFSSVELLDLYKEVVKEIAQLVTDSVSIEVYSDLNTTAEEMIKEGREMNTWVSNAHVKLPANQPGIKAAHVLVKEGIRVNMTLCFTQKQAAAVHLATLGAKAEQVLISPFIGRLDDIGYDGMSLVKNIQTMYQVAGSHVRVLAASIRTREHLMACYSSSVDTITAPFSVLDNWAEDNFPMPRDEYIYNPGLTSIEYKENLLDTINPFMEHTHPLLVKGIQRFAADWNSLLKK